MADLKFLPLSVVAATPSRIKTADGWGISLLWSSSDGKADQYAVDAAASIVESCNNYARLREDNAALVEALEKIRSETDALKHYARMHGLQHNPPSAVHIKADMIIGYVDAALAKARGETQN